VREIAPLVRGLTVREVLAEAGNQVAADAVLIEIEVLDQSVAR